MKSGAFLVFFVISSGLMNPDTSQDYIISFNGSGASSDVTSVKVENLTQGTSKILNGSDILHLVSVITGIETISQNNGKTLCFSRNPMTDNSLMQFDLQSSGRTQISFHDLSGRIILNKNYSLQSGRHSFEISGLSPGLYLITIKSEGYSFSARLLSMGSAGGCASVVYRSTDIVQNKLKVSKGVEADVFMQYNAGDILKFTAYSGDYSTVFTSIPSASSTITFNFISCTDGDNNKYPVVKIGSQTWMAENLKTTRYNDGTAIPNVTGDFAWMILDSPSYCWYNHDIAYKNIYGALYNWFAVATGKLCPDGWHIPSDTEWTELIAFAGGETIAGGKLKETGTAHWREPNTGATNEFGFTGLPGGVREYDGVFQTQTVGTSGYWWSSTATGDGTDIAWNRYLVNSWNNSSRNYVSTRIGSSVRCIKN